MPLTDTSKCVRIVCLALTVLLSVAVLLPAVALPAGADGSREDASSALISTADDLNAAINAASDGDVILVGDITFTPTDTFTIRKSITLRSGKSSHAVLTNAALTLLGSDAGDGSVTVRFEHINFRGENAGRALDPDNPPQTDNSAQAQTALTLSQNLDVTCLNCTFDGYCAAQGGAIRAIYASTSGIRYLNLTLDGCTFQNNAAAYGGAICMVGVSANVRLIAKNCTFDGNGAMTGGAIFAESASVALTECRFTNNKYISGELPSPNGGALALYGCDSTLDGCVFDNNTSGGAGGGIYAEIYPFVTLNMFNCTVTDNRSVSGDGLTVIPGKTALDTPATAYVSFCTVTGNKTQGSSGLADTGCIQWFGCLLSGAGLTDRLDYNESNGYTVTMSPETASESIPAPGVDGHIRLPIGAYPIPVDAVRAYRDGRYAGSLGQLEVGDNYSREATFVLYLWGDNILTVTVPYGQSFTPEDISGSRKGYSFVGWTLRDGSTYDGNGVFLGGNMNHFQPNAEWKWAYVGHEPVIWIPVSVVLILLIGFAVSFLVRMWQARAFAAAMEAQREALYGSEDDSESDEGDGEDRRA